MSFATDMQQVAYELLYEFGQSVTCSRTTQGTFVPSTGAVGAGSSSTYTSNVYPDQYTNSEIDGSSVQFGDIKLYMYSTTQPLVGDTVSLGGIVYRVMSVIRITAQGSDIIYQTQIRV